MNNIEIPKLDKKKIKKMSYFKRVCKHEGCNKEFYGRCNRMYCDEHGTQYWVNRRRKRTRRPKTDPTINNMVIQTKEKIRYRASFKCAVESCNSTFKLTVLPGKHVYRKFCDDHVNPYKRSLVEKNA